MTKIPQFRTSQSSIVQAPGPVPGVDPDRSSLNEKVGDFFFFFFGPSAVCRMQDLDFLTRDQTCVLCSGSTLLITGLPGMCRVSEY